MANDPRRESSLLQYNLPQEPLEDHQGRQPTPPIKLTNSKSRWRHNRSGPESSRQSPAKSKEADPVSQIAQSQPEIVRVQEGSPWKVYEDRYRLELGTWVTVVGKRPREMGQVFVVKSLSGPNAEKDLNLIQQLRHDNFLSVHEIFAYESSFYIVYERVHISLDDIVASPAYPDEAELASIIWQVSKVELFTR
jgi:hypothetical protein